jgi:MFS family permease
MIVAGALAVGTGIAETGSVFLPSLAVTGLGMTPDQASFWMIPTVIALIIGSPLAGRLLDRIGSKIVVQGGLLLTALGFFLFGFEGTILVWFVVGQLLAGIGLASLLGAPLRYVVLTEAGPDQRTAGQGLLSVMLAVGQLMGAALVGAVATSHGGGAVGYQLGFIVVGIIVSVATLVASALKSRAAERAAAGIANA